MLMKQLDRGWIFPSFAFFDCKYYVISVNQYVVNIKRKKKKH